MAAKDSAPAQPASNFIRHIVEADLAAGTYASRHWSGQPGDAARHASGPIDPARIRTRFPPEPNGFLHIGHAKSIGKGSEARAAAFVEITTPSRVTLFGVGVHANIITASILAVLSAVRRADARNLLPAAGKAVGA